MALTEDEARNIARLETLNAYRIMDSVPEREFDDIVEIANAIFDMPISLISILDEKRQWFKAKRGLEGDETPIEHAFCKYAIAETDHVFIVEDVFGDDRFKNNPYVLGDPNIRFYAGAPLIAEDGNAIGTLCVLDSNARKFTEEESRILRMLADKVMERLTLRKENLEKKELLENISGKLEMTYMQLLDAQERAHIGSWEINIQDNTIVWSQEMYRLFEMDHTTDDISIAAWSKMVHPDDLDNVMRMFAFASQEKNEMSINYRIKKFSGGERWLMVNGKNIFSDEGTKTGLKGTAMDITDLKMAEVKLVNYKDRLEELLFAFWHKIRKPVATTIGLVHAIEKEKLPENDSFKQYLDFLKSNTEELDSSVREIADFVYQLKNKKEII